MRMLLFIAFVLSIMGIFIGMVGVVRFIVWVRKKAIQRTDKSEEPETLVTPKRYVATPDEEERMRE